LNIHNISLNNSIANQFLAEVRDINLQKDRLRFRKNLYRLGEILAYEFSKSLNYNEVVITTPMAQAKTMLLSEQPILIPILRAALPFYEGIQNFFDYADAGFVGAARADDFSATGAIDFGYAAVPDLSNKIVTIIDPMLATGNSLVATIDHLTRNGTPKNIQILALIATPAGIGKIEKQIKLPVDVWCIAIDEELNEKAYIVPGLGDAGDLAFGPKV
jgi:uracil phosphoribosyltransferase